MGASGRPAPADRPGRRAGPGQPRAARSVPAGAVRRSRSGCGSSPRTGSAVAGLEFGVQHAPGHTAGCVLLGIDYPGHDQIDRIVFSGDVLFAGSIGRTDLPGGDPEVMRQSLAGPVLEIPDATALLPGHGPQSTMARERATNPYLQPAFLRI
ncbi:MAG: MBL fold metallo-hydrolase [Propionicimonas sp.]